MPAARIIGRPAVAARERDRTDLSKLPAFIVVRSEQIAQTVGQLDFQTVHSRLKQPVETDAKRFPDQRAKFPAIDPEAGNDRHLAVEHQITAAFLSRLNVEIARQIQFAAEEWQSGFVGFA